MLISTRNLFLKKSLNIFYKYEDSKWIMKIGGNNRNNTCMSTSDLKDVYVNHLKEIQVYGNKLKPQRYTFVNMTVSLLEVLIKNKITVEIKNNPEFYLKSWRMMLITGKEESRTKKDFQKMIEDEEPVDIAEGIPKFFTYQSYYALSSITDAFSCVEDFIENEFPNNKKFTENLHALLDARNESTHNLKDTLDMDKADEIKNELDNFIENIEGIIVKSLEYRERITKNLTIPEDQRISDAQKEWLDKVGKTIQEKGGCGQCPSCKKHSRKICSKRAVPGSLWHNVTDQGLEFNEKFIKEFENLRSSLK